MSVVVLAGHDLPKLAQQTTRTCFDPVVVAFCQSVSQSLLKHPQARRYPELVALGFWLRESHLRRLQHRADVPKGIVQLPVGLVLHFTPANVDTMFVYSWVCSLLMGNKNLLRLSSNDSPVKRILLGILKDLFERPEYEPLACRNLFVSYPRDSGIGEDFSLMADARVIWGGDESVRAIRRLPCKPRCRDIPFADRYSVSLINGDQLTTGDLQSVAERLWRDIEPYRQMACSSPRVIFWLGSDELQEALMRCVDSLAQETEVSPGRSMDHLVAAQWLQAQDAAAGPIRSGPLNVVPVTCFRPELLLTHPGQSLCYLVPIDRLEQLEQQLDERCQTLSYWGMESSALWQWLESSTGPVMDRVVPVGQALDFSVVWDGVNLIDQLSRLVTVR